MLFRIPIFVHESKAAFTARPLFKPAPERKDLRLRNVLGKLTRDLIPLLEGLARSGEQEQLASWTFSPNASIHRTTLAIDLRKRSAKVKVLLVQFRHFGRKVAFTPSLPELWFEVPRGHDTDARATEALGEYWRNRERDADEGEDVRPEEMAIEGKAWIEPLEVQARTRVPAKPADASPFLILGGGEIPDGTTELRRVGRCLDWLYPDALERAVRRDAEVNALTTLMASTEPRAALLVGPRQCGKTAILHECVHRMLSDYSAEGKRKPGQVWLVSPQRLISGMSYVGQWEARLLAILKHARKRKHTLYFDDLVGLFLAGQSANSTLSAARVLKPYIEDRSVRVVAEASPEQLRVLRERDRSFADLFEIVSVAEPSDAETLRILIEVERRLEERHSVRFGLDVLPAVIEVQRRANRTAAFPGKAANVLARLAVRAAKASPGASLEFDDWPVIDRDSVYQDQAESSGIAADFLDPAKPLKRNDLRRKLAERVIGQAEAVDALTDAIGLLKARLGDPHRPLASFLFLGPTGVGKTEAAKAAATVLFGDSARLLRFDLNEFADTGSAARLVGTFRQPEGLLTGAVRHRPFCVLLLDEIEKADPDVHDLLLQVLGEGRLTDALGQTTDFTNCLILMTSNLGAREAESRLGLNPDADKSMAYQRAARNFFRPEFFNRIDRIIPFTKLPRESMRMIAERLVMDLLAREGFRQRKCVFEVLPEAIDLVVDRGYDPDLGARAMKRAVERELARPAAAILSEIVPDHLNIVGVRVVEGKLSIVAQPLQWLENQIKADDRDDDLRIENDRAILKALKDRFLADQAGRGVVVAGAISPEQQRYFAIRERMTALEDQLKELETGPSRHREQWKLESIAGGGLGRKVRYRAMKRNDWDPPDQPFRSVFAALSMEEALQELLDSAEPLPGNLGLDAIRDELVFLKYLIESPARNEPVHLQLLGLPNAPDDAINCIANFLKTAFNAGLDLEARIRDDNARAGRIDVFGFHAAAFIEREVGTHLFFDSDSTPHPVRLIVADAPGPASFGPVVRVYRSDGSGGFTAIDSRTGLVGEWIIDDELLRRMMLASLPEAE